MQCPKLEKRERRHKHALAATGFQRLSMVRSLSDVQVQAIKEQDTQEQGIIQELQQAFEIDWGTEGGYDVHGMGECFMFGSRHIIWW